jgi:hypothetical protein
MADTETKDWTIDSMRSAVQPKIQENGVPERPTRASIALNKQPMKLFSLCKGIT